jgi:hypothetical protein
MVFVLITQMKRCGDKEVWSNTAEAAEDSNLIGPSGPLTK